MSSAAPDFSPSRVADTALQAKYLQVLEALRALDSALIGFSGGVDSTLLAGAARHALGKERAWACLATGPSLAEREYRDALRLAELLDLELKEFAGTEFANPAYVANGPDRCFHCKTDLFLHLERFAKARPGAALLYGGNADDASDYRPGQRAARAHGARAPLAEAGLTKAEVRSLSRAFGLPTADKPAMPCLSSRIPYGTAVDAAKLAQVAAGEALLADMGFREARLRHEGATARIEVPLDQFSLLAKPAVASLEASLRALGFRALVVDARGFRSGSLNEALPEHVKREQSGGL